MSRSIIAYYDNEAKDYWIDDGPKGWRNLSETGLIRELKIDGFDPKPKKDSFASPIDLEIQDIQKNFRADYVGPVAGWPKGLHNFYGKQGLVTSSPNLLVPKEGDWKLWHACLESLLGAGGSIQIDTWKANDKLFLECLYGNFYRPGAASFLVGKKDSGKSFLQDIRTVYYGGRCANPWLYIQNRTSFNRELFGAEHLKVSDPHMYKNEDKTDFGDMIKNFLMDEPQSCHGKFREQITLPPRRRLSVSCNRELHNLVIPSLDDSMLDKMDLNMVGENAIPPQGYEDVPYGEFKTRILAELPAYVWHLQNEFKIAPERQSRRCGVKTWHHPELVQVISESLPETRFWHALDDYHLLEPAPWRGLFTELLKALEPVSTNPDVKPFTSRPNQIPFLLSKLQSRFPDKVKRLGNRVGKSRQQWEIWPPGK